MGFSVCWEYVLELVTLQHLVKELPVGGKGSGVLGEDENDKYR